MNERICEILANITELEDELRNVIDTQQHELRYRVEGTRVRFEAGIREAHRRFKIGLLPWLRGARLRVVATAPVIYGMAVPLALLDLAATCYQQMLGRLRGELAAQASVEVE